MANYITKEIGLDNMTLPPHGVEILYSIWTIKDKKTGHVILHDDHDTVNITSRIFTNVFELGKTYIITLSMVRTDGPTIATDPFEVTISATGDISDKFHIPSVIDTPIISTEHELDSVPNSNAIFTSSEFMCFGNAVHKATNWWLISDDNKLIWESIDDETNLTSIRLDKLNLNPNRLYTLLCIYKGTNRDTSAAGSITFGIKDYPELRLREGIYDIRYNMGAELALAQSIPGMQSFTWEVWGEDKMLLATDTNNNGTVNIPKEYNDKIVFNLEDGYSYYNLRVKATVGGNVIGWKDTLFNPLEYSINSIKWNLNVNYEPRPSIVQISTPSLGDIERYEPITGITCQLPDGLVLLPRGGYKFGLYTVSNKGLMYDLYKIVEIPGIKTTNTNPGKHNILFRPLENNKILFCPDTANLNAYLYILEYDIINKKFSLEREINLAKTDTELGYTEYHYLDNDRVLMCTVKDNIPTIANNYRIRVLNTETGVVTELKDKSHTPASLYSNLIRTGSNTFTVLGSTLANMKTEDGRALSLTINPDDSFTVSGLTTDMYDNLLVHDNVNISKRLRSVQLQNGNTLIYTPDYYDSGSNTVETIKYNIFSGENVLDSGFIILDSNMIKDTNQSLGLTIKLNDGSVVLGNGKNLFGLLFKTTNILD